MSNLELALTMLQVTSGLAGFALVSTGLIPFLLERAQGHYQRLLAERQIKLMVALTRLAFLSFVISVLLSLSWSVALSASLLDDSAITLLGIGCLATFLSGLGLTTFLVIRLLQADMFSTNK